MKVILRVRWDLPWLDAEGRDRFPYRCTIAWQRERWDLFTRYTLPSLRAQTHSDWEAWLLVDKQNDEVHERLTGLCGYFTHSRWLEQDNRVRFVYSPNGCAQAMVDDYPPEDIATVLVMRIDSDDLLAPDSLGTIVKHAHEGRPYVGLDTGVAWYVPTETLYRWVINNGLAVPPFYGRVVKAVELASGLPGLGHHGKIRPECYSIETEEPMFCVLLHDSNISNRPDWRAPEKIEGERKMEIMRRFGL